MQQQLQRNTTHYPCYPLCRGRLFWKATCKGKVWATFISHAHLAQPSPLPAPSYQLQCDREPPGVQTAPSPAPRPLSGWGSSYLDLWITGSCLKFLLGSMPVKCTSGDNSSSLACFLLGNKIFIPRLFVPQLESLLDESLPLSPESL